MSSENAQGCLNGLPVKNYNVAGGCVVVLPTLNYLEKEFPAEDFGKVPCERAGTTCSRNCYLNVRGFGHPVIVLEVRPEWGSNAETIRFAQLSSSRRDPRHLNRPILWMSCRNDSGYQVECPGFGSKNPNILLPHIYELPVHYFRNYAQDDGARPWDIRLEKDSYQALLDVLGLRQITFPSTLDLITCGRKVSYAALPPPPEASRLEQEPLSATPQTRSKSRRARDPKSVSPPATPDQKSKQSSKKISKTTPTSSSFNNRLKRQIEKARVANSIPESVKKFGKMSRGSRGDEDGSE